MTDEELRLIETFRTGIKIEDFIDTDVFRYLISRATEQRIEAQLALEEVSPTDTKAITELQIKAQVGKRFEQWLYEGINAKNMADQLINSEEMQ